MASNLRPNQLQRSNGNMADIRNLGGLQNVGNLAMHNNTQNAIPLSSSYLQPQNSGLPPLPPRRNLMSSYGGRGMMGTMGGGYYSPYSNPYSRYPTNMGYGGYRTSPYREPYGDQTSAFIQMAEESTRPAFESIESVVEVVSSISMMLESTYHAVHSSYSAILGVVDQFSRLKNHLAQMLSILALFRGLRWLCLKCLYLLKLRKDNPSAEAAWNIAEKGGQPPLPPRLDKANGSAWPFLMFVGLVIGAPWLMFKLLSKTVPKTPLDTKAFRDENGRLNMAMTTHEFKATTSDELSFSAGEKLYISPASRYSNNGWILACNSKQETGLIPSTYLRVTAKNQGNSQNIRCSSQQAQTPPRATALRVKDPLAYLTQSNSPSSKPGYSDPSPPGGATAARGQQPPQNPLADLTQSTSAPSQPGNSDPSRSSVPTTAWDIANFVQKYNAAKCNESDSSKNSVPSPALGDFSSYIRSINASVRPDLDPSGNPLDARPLDGVVFANERLDGRPLDFSKNANEQLNSPSNSQANDSGNSDASERFNPQPGSSKNLSEDLSTDKTGLGALDFSKSNSEVAKKATKNQNGNTTD